jgi:hypothetical protein
MQPKSLDAVRRIQDERRHRESLPKPIAIAVDFVSSMCASQPPPDVVRLLRKYEDKLREAEREFANSAKFAETRDVGASGSGDDEAQGQQAEHRARQAIDEAHRATAEASRLLEIAIREAERRDREEEQRRADEQRRREDEDRRQFEERNVREREHLAELATSAVVATELAIQAIRRSELTLVELRTLAQPDSQVDRNEPFLAPLLRLEREGSNS